jgi:hypothetical protein
MVPEPEEPEPDRDGADHDLVEIQIRLPEAARSTPLLAERLIQSIAGFQSRAAFELVGIGGTTFLQFAVPRPNVPAATTLLETFVEGVATATQPTLARAWCANPDDAGVVVDFGLAAEFMYPLARAMQFDVDPLLAFVAVLEALSPGEIGVVQVLFEPTRSPWASNALRALVNDDGEPFFRDGADLLSAARAKLASPLLACVIRVAARAASTEQAWAIVRRLGAGFGQFAQGGSNELIPLRTDETTPADHARDLVERRSHRTGMLLSLAELAGVAHVPSSAVRTASLRELPGATHAAPESLRAGDVNLGENVHRGQRAEVRLPLTVRLRHTHIIGATGTGKSTLLKSLLRQDMETGRGIALLDPHGDLADEVLGLVPEERLREVVLFDPADEEFPIGFNVLRAYSDRERNLLASDLTAIFRRFSTTWGDQMTAVMSAAVMALLECDGGGTLLDLRRFLADREFRDAKLQSVHDPLLLAFWHDEFPRLPGARSQLPIITRLDAFLRPKSVRNIVAQRETRLDLRTLIDSGGILIARLSQGAIGEENAHLLGSLLVAKLHQVAMSREQVPESERTPFLLYLDEFQHFVTPSLTGLLTGARKYGVGLVLAHQELRQLRDDEVRGAVLANPATRVCFRLGDDDARLLGSGFASFEAADLLNLGVGEAICRVGQSGHDFNLRVPTPQRVDPVRARVRREAAREGTRERLGTARSEVEATIAAAWSPSGPARSPRPARTPRPPERTPAPSAAPPMAQHATPRPPESAPAEPPGRGGAQHKYLQALIRERAQALGYRATIEAPVGSRGRADVLLDRDGVRIAVEISVTTSSHHELENVRKCLNAGADQVVVVSPSADTLQRLSEQVQGELAADLAARVRVSAPEAFLAELRPPPEPAPTSTLGYSVRTKITAGDTTSTSARKQAIAQTIAGALRRLRRT